ncbi:MAG: hypothetical protein K8S20_10725 [Chloroflexi bacterium]|nr:hypothetical protein [Chloroflexota bacterium]
MKPRFIFWTLSLAAVLLLSACAPAAPATPTASALSVSTLTLTTPELTAPESTVVPPVQPAATSRGPNLEATDPSTVNLASGHLQLIEFFRFT